MLTAAVFLECAVSHAEARSSGRPLMLPVQDDPAPSAEAAAKPRSALMLYRLCEVKAKQPLNWCEGYLLGAADVLLAMGNSQMTGGICDADYDPATLGRIFEVWVERHPERQQYDMMIAAQAAVRD